MALIGEGCPGIPEGQKEKSVLSEGVHMRNRFRLVTIMVASAAVGAVVSLSVTRTVGQAQRAARIDGHPNFGGIWQALNEADWDLEAHNALPGFVWQQGVHPL